MNTHIANAPEPVHLVALSGCHTMADKIRYACEHNRPNPTPAAVRAWLTRYHVTTEPTYVSDVVTAWRAANNLGAAVPSVTGHGGAVVTVRPKPVGVVGFYTVAFMSMLVSIDTSWRFFGDVLHITDTAERIVMFAVLEVALLACGWGMRANVRRSGRPGAPRLVAWVLCGLAAYMAWQLSGVAAGVARVALGPALGLVMLHLALGIEIRTGQHKATTWTRIGRELRERFLSRLGLSDDERDALARTRDRAARRVARLSLGGWVPFRAARVARALRASNVAHDPAARARMLAELAAIRHAGDLAALDQPSPWGSAVNGTTNAATNGAAGVHDGAGGSFANGAAAVQDTPGEHRSRTTRPRSRNGRQTGGTGSRKLFADYLTEARAAWSPGTVVTPAWVREHVACSRGTSQKVADALTEEIQNGHVEVAA
jgi:hypothetical protein